MFNRTWIASACICGIALGQAQAAELGINLPMDGTTISNHMTVYGWAVDQSGIAKVELFIDGKPGAIRLSYGGQRGDIAAKFPGIPSARLSGFAAVIPTQVLANGPHSLRFLATAKSGQKSEAVQTILISNLPGATNKPAPALKLGNASARVSRGKLFLDNVLIGNTYYDNLDFTYQPATRSFALSAFNDDSNRDGYHDDDSNHDGYHDGDSNQDGFVDDSNGHTVLPGVPMPLAEIKGVVQSISGTTLVVFSTDSEHGGAVGNISIDFSSAVIDDSLPGGVQVGDAIEAKGAWNGSTLKATFIEADEDATGGGDDSGGGGNDDNGGGGNDDSSGNDDNGSGGNDDSNHGVQPGVPLADAEVKGIITSLGASTLVVNSTDPEHGGAVGNVTINYGSAVIDDSISSGLSVGLAIEAKGSWDGSVLSATMIELDD